MQNYENVDEYLATFSSVTRKKLDGIRKLIQETVPEAKEKISYGIPTFTLNGKNLVHFAGYKTHIGLYPGSGPIKQFAQELSGYETSKGTIKFPLDKALPLDLIKKVTKTCAERNLSKKS